MSHIFRSRVGLVFALVVLSVGVAGAQARPDFSGTWVFDAAASMTNAKDAKMLAGPIFSSRFIATQTATALTLDIEVGDRHVPATYALNGDESRNQSPAPTPDTPPIDVFSRAKWEGDHLVIASRSVSIERAGPVTVETTRTLWFDDAGRLVVMRTGTPANLVQPSRSVYHRQ